MIASALGVTQDLVRHLGALGRTLRLHPTALRACEVAVAQGLPLQRFAPLDGEGEVVVLPPTARLGRLQLGEHRTCVLSGRATPAPGADETIALTDHAGFEELIAYALASEARRVLVVHGHSEELAEALRDRGLPAQAVREHHHQLKLPGF